MSKYAKLSAGLLAVWLVFSLSSSALHLYRNAPNTPPIAFGLAVITPILLFLVWFASSPGFRQFVLALSPRTLTLVQSMRIAGFVFLVLGVAAVGLAGGNAPGFFDNALLAKEIGAVQCARLVSGARGDVDANAAVLRDDEGSEAK